LRECLWLIRHGVPFDVAFSLSDVERAGWCIIISEQGGRKFNMSTMDFEKVE
jgi:hypothetical protein